MPADDLATARTCGSCGLCCKVFDIEVLEKAAHDWCGHYSPGRGCTIYGTRPAICRKFKCRWLTDELLGEEWRPENCGFVVGTSETGIGIWVTTDRDRPASWRREPFYGRIKNWSEVARRGAGYVAVTQGDRVFLVFPEQEVEIDGVVPKVSIKAGYRISPAGRQPIAFVRSPEGVVKEFSGSHWR